MTVNSTLICCLTEEVATVQKHCTPLTYTTAMVDIEPKGSNAYLVISDDLKFIKQE